MKCDQPEEERKEEMKSSKAVPVMLLVAVGLLVASDVTFYLIGKRSAEMAAADEVTFLNEALCNAKNENTRLRSVTEEVVEASKAKDCENRAAVSYILGRLTFAKQADLDKVFGDGGVNFAGPLIYFVDGGRNIRFIADDTNTCGLWSFESTMTTADNDGEED